MTSPAPPFDVDTVMQALSEVVAEVGPDYRYWPDHPIGKFADRMCYYVEIDGTAGCIVGRVLHRLGIPITELRLWEGAAAFMMRDPVHGKRALLTGAAAQCLSAAQRRQDRNLPWGEALRAAERERLLLHVDAV